MKKLKHYPTMWQAYPFSIEMFAHFEQEARLNNQEARLVPQKVKKERKPRLRLAFNFW